MQWERPDAARKAQWNSEKNVRRPRPAAQGIADMDGFAESALRRENAKKFQDAITSIL